MPPFFYLPPLDPPFKRGESKSVRSLLLKKGRQIRRSLLLKKGRQIVSPCFERGVQIVDSCFKRDPPSKGRLTHYSPLRKGDLFTSPPLRRGDLGGLCISQRTTELIQSYIALVITLLSRLAESVLLFFILIHQLISMRI